MSEDFYRADPTPYASWRLAVLMGRNVRTYKFALGHALLEAAAQDRTEIPLTELATTYATGLLRRLEHAPQASPNAPATRTDPLVVAAEEAAESRRIGRPTERLVEAATANMPGMVMRKFHNLHGSEVPHRFYEVTGRGRDRLVRLTPALRRVALSERIDVLRGELRSRWEIVESSFSTGIGPALLAEGLVPDLADGLLYDRRRRRPVTGVRDAVIGFQHGRCLSCHQPINADDECAVDHVFPYALMDRLGAHGGWKGPDLDAVWNLAPAHAACNSAKSDHLPGSDELRRLAERNEAVMRSPVPLRRTLELALRNHRYNAAKPGEWRRFVRDVNHLINS
ncbi:HNH endonuclease [Actinomadura kijaniata]|uniref:HNH endonuclease n=1 Tax=Actinomadura kijaniata TaxID=46161 RepID=UPI00082A2F99|nr:HNH endonuclease domain-containing protein [Actinomadura kijaniata]